jgi:hypothetical protein
MTDETREMTIEALKRTSRLCIAEMGDGIKDDLILIAKASGLTEDEVCLNFPEFYTGGTGMENFSDEDKEREKQDKLLRGEEFEEEVKAIEREEDDRIEKEEKEKEIWIELD